MYNTIVSNLYCILQHIICELHKF